MSEKAKLAKDVPQYIAAAPRETRAQLRELRKLVIAMPVHEFKAETRP